MDTAYILMAVVAAASFTLALLGAGNWLAVALPSLSPVGLMIGMLFFGNTKGAGGTLLSTSPLMVALVFIYGIISVVSASLGRAIGRRFLAVK
jgi:hypothetical protein